jgi:alpha-ketoglutarate-dependent taurine dioxygenase
MRQHYSQNHMPGYSNIGLVLHKNGQKVSENWHTDHTNHEKPPLATMLYGVEIPSAGGGTSIASMRAAYDALSKTSGSASAR